MKCCPGNTHEPVKLMLYLRWFDFVMFTENLKLCRIALNISLDYTEQFNF